MFKVQHFPFFIRQAQAVADAIAGTISRFPSLLSMKGDTQNDGTALASFRYEGGVKVTVCLFNMDRLTESWRNPHIEDWVVYAAEAAHYAKDDLEQAKPKVTTSFDADALNTLRSAGSWHHPRVRSIDQICGRVAIKFERSGGAYAVYIEVDPDSSQNQLDSLSYRVLVPGDREAVCRQAKAKIVEPF